MAEHISPPWEAASQRRQPLQEPLLISDDGDLVDLTQFVRYELHISDIRYGVLDLVVRFPHNGQYRMCYLLHFFPVDT